MLLEITPAFGEEYALAASSICCRPKSISGNEYCLPDHQWIQYVLEVGIRLRSAPTQLVMMWRKGLSSSSKAITLETETKCTV